MASKCRSNTASKPAGSTSEAAMNAPSWSPRLAPITHPCPIAIGRFPRPAGLGPARGRSAGTGDGDDLLAGVGERGAVPPPVLDLDHEAGVVEVAGEGGRVEEAQGRPADLVARPVGAA